MPTHDLIVLARARRSSKLEGTVAIAQQQSSRPPRSDERFATKGIASWAASRTIAWATTGSRRSRPVGPRRTIAFAQSQECGSQSPHDCFWSRGGAARAIAKATKEASGSGSPTPMPDECIRRYAAVRRRRRSDRFARRDVADRTIELAMVRSPDFEPEMIGRVVHTALRRAADENPAGARGLIRRRGLARDVACPPLMTPP